MAPNFVSMPQSCWLSGIANTECISNRPAPLQVPFTTSSPARLTSGSHASVELEVVLLEPCPGLGSQVHSAAHRRLVLQKRAARAQQVALQWRTWRAQRAEANPSSTALRHSCCKRCQSRCGSERPHTHQHAHCAHKLQLQRTVQALCAPLRAARRPSRLLCCC